MSEKKAIYLKTNRTEEWAIDNLHIWMKISFSLGYDTFIICDNPALSDKIAKMEFAGYTTIIPSIKDTYAKSVVEKIAIPRWHNAAYAHLSTFIHAYENNYESFWNIDADDTLFCLPIDRIVEILKLVEKYALKQCIDCFSLDMWYSKLLGNDWSFGITFTNNNISWMELISNCSSQYKTDEISHGNIDNYFYYLREIKGAVIETWYVENLVFIHFATDMMRHFMQSGVYHWKDGTLYSPIAGIFGDMDVISQFPIIQDAIKFDVDITDEDSHYALLYYSKDGHVRNRFPYISWVDVEGDSIVSERQNRFNIDKFGKKKIEYIPFGAGWYFNYHIKFISKYNKIRYVGDNNSDKHNRIINGLKCISPTEMKNMDDIAAVIMLNDLTIAGEVSRQLEQEGIKNIHYKDWERAVFSDNMFM